MVKFIKNIILKLIYAIVFTYILVFVPVIIGYKPLVVLSGSMEPILKVGGILYYQKINIEDYKKGDILVYATKDHIISHRIVDIASDGFITKGDNNEVLDSKVNLNQVLGKGTNFSIPYIGYYADFIYNHKYILYFFTIYIVIDLINYNINNRSKNE